VIHDVQYKDSKFIIRDDSSAYVVPRTNLHIMSKKYLQSENFHKLVKDLLDD